MYSRDIMIEGIINHGFITCASGNSYFLLDPKKMDILKHSLVAKYEPVTDTKKLNEVICKILEDERYAIYSDLIVETICDSGCVFSKVK